MSILFYKRPDYVEREGGPLSRSNCQKYVERAACSRAAIPEELSFENVMEGKTMPPCSLADFLDYLVYVSHDAENLQFFLWLRNYTKRFNALPQAQKRLSPKWMPEDALPDLTTAKKHTSPKSQSPKVGSSNNNDMSAYFRDGAPTPDLTLQSELDFQLKQPFRTEVSQITAHYIVAGGPRELNLSYKDRSSLLNALSQTTHPSVFAPVLKLTTMMLRNHSHPNFVRWSLCNGNKPRVFFLRSFAVWWLIVAVLLAILLILSHESRWLRIVVAPVLWFGITNLVAASKGLCVLLHRLHTREVHPWELESKAPGEDPSKGWRERKKGGKESKEDGKAVTLHLKPPKIAGANNCYTNISTPPLDPKDKNEAKTGFESDVEALSMLSGSTLAGKMSPFGPSNTFDHEPWVSRWRKQAWWRKLHLRKVWVRDEGLRLMQNRIVIQAELWALLITVPTVVGIVACPVVGLY